nr:FAD-dependent monooxygenase [Klebsiella variicola]
MGDAAHLMLPFGEGANLALEDGAELGLAIAANADNPEAALSAYEEQMFIRVESAANDAQAMAGILFGDETPGALLHFFLTSIKQDPHPRRCGDSCAMNK